MKIQKVRKIHKIRTQKHCVYKEFFEITIKIRTL